MNDDKPLSERDFCEYFGITRFTCLRLRRKGLLPHVRLGGKVFYFKDEVLAFLRKDAGNLAPIKKAA